MISFCYKFLPFILKLLVSRALFATSHYNNKYLIILKWLSRSRETTNFTYELTEKNLNYLIQVTSVVTNKSYEVIRSYMNEALDNKTLLDHILSVSQKEAPNKMNQLKKESNSFGRRLGWYMIARATKPKVIVETGVERGHGALILNFALERNFQEGHAGEYIGTDINPTAGILFNEYPNKMGKVIYGDSIETLSKLDKEIDLFINDSDHSASYEEREYETVRSKLSPKSIIIGDNAHVTDKLSNYSIKNHRNFLFFKEEPKNHWYPGAGIGISYN